MGQRANGILYGCKCPDLPNDEEGEAASELVDRWRRANGINWLERDKPAIRCEGEGGIDLLGVWVAVGGSGEDDAPYFMEEAMRVSDVEQVYMDSIVRATKLWDEFAAWVLSAEGVLLPSADLWLTPCETA